MIRKFLTLCSLVALASLPVVAHADQIYSFDVSGCTGCAPAPFGQVDIHQVTSTEVSVTVSLTQGTTNVGEVFANSSGNPLEFNLTGAGTFSISGLTSGFTPGTAGGYTAPSLTSPPTSANLFGYAIICGTACPSGSTGTANTLTFFVTDTSGISYLNFTPNGQGIFFATDIFVNGATGNVGSSGTPAAVPEPSSLMLLGTGILGTAVLFRRKLISAVNHG